MNPLLYLVLFTSVLNQVAWGRDDIFASTDFKNYKLANPRFEGIGSYNGKLFFADAAPVNWNGANQLCRDNSLEMLNPDSSLEWSFLTNALTGANMTGYFWTEARDTKTFLSHGGNGGPLGFPLTLYSTNNENCIALRSTTTSYLYIMSCNVATVAKSVCQVRIS